MATVRQYTQWWHSVVIALVIFYLSIMRVPSDYIAPWMTAIHFDKIVHFLLFFLLSVTLAYDGLTPLQLENRRVKLVRLTILMPLFYGGVLELIQEYACPTRTGSWLDWAADIAGAVVSYAVIRYWMSKRKNRQFE